MFYYSLLFVFQFCGAIWFGYCPLAHTISSVFHYLTCFGGWLIAHLLSVFTAFLCLFTDSSVLRLAACPCPFLLCSFNIPPAPLLSMFDYKSLFAMQFCWGDQSAQGLCWFVFSGVDRGVPHSMCCSPVYSIN
jgi:hypothetical protein